MNLPWPFRKAEREPVAALRDEVITLGTMVRFLVADKPRKPLRDAGGRFVSRKQVVTDSLKEALKNVEPEQRTQFKDRASRRERVS